MESASNMGSLANKLRPTITKKENKLKWEGNDHDIKRRDLVGHKLGGNPAKILEKSRGNVA